MHRWATEGLIFFNAAVAAVDIVVLLILHRSRKPIAWWGAGVGAAVVSFLLVTVFAFGPSFLSRAHLAGYRTFPVIGLVAYVLFVHVPICLFGAAVLMRKTSRKTALLSALGAAVLWAVAVDAFLIEPQWLEVTHRRIESPKIERSVRIAVLADLQVDDVGPYERRVLAQIRAEKPDLVLLAGDYLQAPRDRSKEVCDKLNTLFGEIPFDASEGTFAVQGNVDTWHPWISIFRGLPIVPVPATCSFKVAGIELTCLSKRDSFNPRLQIERRDPDRFHVVLGHSPDFALGRIDADLLLAGHTHGGQVRLPVIGPLSNGCAIPRQWSAGLTRLPSGARLIVSRGAGLERAPAPELRFLCRPEVVIIDLVPEEKK